MIVNVEIELDCEVTENHKNQSINIAEELTINKDSITLSVMGKNNNVLNIEFSIRKAKQIDIVDKIGKEFSVYMENYSDSSIRFK